MYVSQSISEALVLTAEAEARTETCQKQLKLLEGYKSHQYDSGELKSRLEEAAAEEQSLVKSAQVNSTSAAGSVSQHEGTNTTMMSNTNIRNTKTKV